MASMPDPGRSARDARKHPPGLIPTMESDPPKYFLRKHHTTPTQIGSQLRESANAEKY
jgi:hypothetical protein